MTAAKRESCAWGVGFWVSRNLGIVGVLGFLGFRVLGVLGFSGLGSRPRLWL